MKKLSDYLMPDGNEIVIGDYTVWQLDSGNYYIQHESGEGAEVEPAELEEKISDLYREML